MSRPWSRLFIALAATGVGLVGALGLEPAARPPQGRPASRSVETESTSIDRAPIRGRVTDAQGRGLSGFEVRLQPLPDAVSALLGEPPSGSLREHLERRSAWYDAVRSGDHSVTTDASGEFVVPDVAVPVQVEPLGGASHPVGAVVVDGAPAEFAWPGSRVEIHGLPPSALEDAFSPRGGPAAAFSAVRSAVRSAVVSFDPPLLAPRHGREPTREGSWSGWRRERTEPEAPPIIHWLGAPDGSPVDRDLLHRDGVRHHAGWASLELIPGYYWFGIAHDDQGFDWTSGVHIGPGKNSIAHTFADRSPPDSEPAPPLFARIEATPPIPPKWLTVWLIDRSTELRRKLVCTPISESRVRLQAGSREANEVLSNDLEERYDLLFDYPGRSVRVPARDSREVVVRFEEAGMLQIAVEGASLPSPQLELVSLARQPRPSVRLVVNPWSTVQTVACDPGDYLAILKTETPSVTGPVLIERVRVEVGRQSLQLTLGQEAASLDLEATDVVIGLCGERFRDLEHLDAIRERLARVAHRHLRLPAMILRDGRVLEVELTADRLAWGLPPKWKPAPDVDGDRK